MAREPQHRSKGEPRDIGSDRAKRRAPSDRMSSASLDRINRRIEKRPAIKSRTTRDAASGSRATRRSALGASGAAASSAASGARSTSRSARGTFAEATASSHERAARRFASSRASAPQGNRNTKILLIAGIALIAIALILAAFLLFRYISADQKYQGYVEAAGLSTQDLGAPDVSADAVTINWDALKQINPDIVGWITIPNTRINYPIVKTDNNDFYLNHLFDRSGSENGAIFADFEGDAKLQGRNNMIYGHNMMDGSMFAGLKEYGNQEFYDAHKTILLFTPEKNFKLEAVSVLLCDAEDKIRQVNFSSDGAYYEYVNMLLGYAQIGELNSNNIPSSLYCLATCTDFNNTKRFVVVAKNTDPAAGLNAPSGTPAEAPAEAPVEAPVEAPAEAPTDTPAA